MLEKGLTQVEAILRLRRSLRYNVPNDFDLQTANRIIEQFDSITMLFGVFAIAISAVGLLVGGIGVMNIMLVTVTERTREIGVRKALGARKQDIMIQFLIESATLSLVGGLIGIALGSSIALIVAAVSPLPAAIKWWAVLLAM